MPAIPFASLAVLLSILLLVGGTVVVCLALALAARAVDRLWDALAPSDEDRRPARAATTRTRRRVALPRSVVAAGLAAMLLFALAWLTFVAGRAPGLA